MGGGGGGAADPRRSPPPRPLRARDVRHRRSIGPRALPRLLNVISEAFPVAIVLPLPAGAAEGEGVADGGGATLSHPAAGVRGRVRGPGGAGGGDGAHPFLPPRADGEDLGLPRGDAPARRGSPCRPGLRVPVGPRRGDARRVRAAAAPGGHRPVPRAEGAPVTGAGPALPRGEPCPASGPPPASSGLGATAAGGRAPRRDRCRGCSGLHPARQLDGPVWVGRLPP